MQLTTYRNPVTLYLWFILRCWHYPCLYCVDVVMIDELFIYHCIYDAVSSSVCVAWVVRKLMSCFSVTYMALSAMLHVVQ